MKKTLAIVLALMVVLCSTALAANSPTTKNTTKTTTKTNTYTAPTVTAAPVPEVEVVPASDTAETATIKNALVAQGEEKVLDTIKASAEETGTNLNLPVEYKTVKDITTQKIVGDTSKLDSLEVSYSFAETFVPNETVYLLIGIPGPNGTVEWVCVQGKVDANGKVVVNYDKELLTKLGNKEFVVVPVTK